MEKIAGIYCIENIINNKKYIGQSSDINRRWYEHKRILQLNEHYNDYLQKSWNKYGEKNFVFYIIDKVDDTTSLNELEMYYIDYFKTTNPLYGYNLTAGGEGGVGYHHTEEYKKWLSEYQKGRKLSFETKQRLREVWRKKINNGYMPKTDHLKKYNDEQKESIDCYNNNGDFVCSYNSIHEAANYLHLEATNICKVLKRKHSNIKGYVFYYSNDIPPDSMEIFLRCSKQPVILYDNNYNVISIFHNVLECSQFINTDNSYLSRQCRNNGLIKGRYYCKYYYDVYPENRPIYNR